MRLVSGICNVVALNVGDAIIFNGHVVNIREIEDIRVDDVRYRQFLAVRYVAPNSLLGVRIEFKLATSAAVVRVIPEQAS